MRTKSRCWLVLAVLVVAGCAKEDNSADTDQATRELQVAQKALSEHSESLTSNEAAIEQQQRELARQQQELADRQKLLAQQKQELAAAKENLNKARVAFAAAVKERFAKLEASLATLATRTDARSTDAMTGLRARRDQLAATLAALTGTLDANWNEYTIAVDTTFDAIEHDLREALK
jgi:septal ring factor EnvC (AmiA/AmiB activator)